VIEGDARWIAYLVFALFVLIQLWWRRAQLPDRLTIGGLWLFIFATSTVFTFGSLINRWLGLGHEGSMYVGQEFDPVRPQIAIASLLIVLASLSSSRQQFVSKELMLITFISALTLAALMNTRLGDLVVGYRGHNLLLYFIALSLVASVIWREINGPVQVLPEGRGHIYVSWGVLLSAHVGLSLRVDGLTVPGAWFHVGYFTGVVQTVKDGGLLLWDTPSQYGFLNMLLAATVPDGSGQGSFLKFQSAMLILVGSTVLVSIWSAARSRIWIVLGATFLILLHFADPAIIGPQPFPSSSVVRFGPSLSLLALISIARGRRHTYLACMALVSSLGLLWSFESFFYCSLILVGWFLGGTEKFNYSRALMPSMRFVLLGTVLTTTSVILVYSGYVVLRVGNLPNWSWFYLPASKFAEGFGGLPTDVWGAGVLLLVGILVNVMRLSEANYQNRPICTASVGAILGWFTYYIGRSHSSNVIAMFPLIFVAILLPGLRLVKQNRDGEHNCSEIRDAAPDGRLKIVRASASLVTVFAAISVASFFANPVLPEAISKFRVLPAAPVFDAGADASESLIDLLRSSEVRTLPIAYIGNLGLLPSLPEELSLSSSGSWLPQPLGLLEEPIPREERLQMLRRFIERDPQDGYLIWHKSNSIPGRFEEWIADLAQTHDCKSVAENDDWQICECTLRVR